MNIMKDEWMVLRSNSWRSELVKTEPKRMVNTYRLREDEHYHVGYVDPTSNNIVAVAITAGSSNYPTRWNRIETGDHMNPFGPKGGLRGVCGVVVRDGK
jgi:hypothetical protein